MILADYLENKAEYIFDNYSKEPYVDHYSGITREELEDNREVIVDRLKRGLRELAQIHDDTFSSGAFIEKHEINEFDGSVYVYWVKGPEMRRYIVHLNFPHWSFSKIMLEQTNKEFEDIFTVNIQVSPKGFVPKDTSENFFGFHAEGKFINTDRPYYLPDNLLFLNPVISELHKSNLFAMFKKWDVRKLLLDYHNMLRYYNDRSISFGDFILLRLDGKYLRYADASSKYLLVSKKPKETGVDAIELKNEEYDDIVRVIEHIKETRKVPSINIFLKNVLLKYAYLKIKGDNQ